MYLESYGQLTCCLASVSSAISVSPISHTTSGDSKNETNEIELSIEVATLLETESQKSNLMEGSIPKFSEPTAPLISSTKGYDWALLELSEASVVQANEAFWKNESLSNLALPHQLASKPTAATDVVAIKGYSGISKGILSSSTTMMKLAQSGKFHEVWTVRFDSPLGKSEPLFLNLII